MPDGPLNSDIRRAAPRPSDVESAVSASADEGLYVCVFGSEAQAAHTRRAMPATANRTRRRFEPGEELAARSATPAAFDERCIPGDSVAPRSNTDGILARRALSAGRIARLGATPDWHHGLLGPTNATARETKGRQCFWGTSDTSVQTQRVRR